MSGPAAVAPPASRKALLIAFLVVFIDLLGFGIVLPLLPRFGQAFVPVGTPAILEGVIIAVLYSSFSAMQFLCAPFWGKRSDSVGRRPILLIGLAGSSLSYLLFAVACVVGDQQAGSSLALVLILVSRVLAGAAGATIPVAQAVVADCTTPENRAKGMGLIGAAFGFGFTFGPLIAFVGMRLFPGEPGAPGLLAALLSATALVVGWRVLPETLRADSNAAHRELLDIGGLLRTLRLPGIGVLVLTFFLATFGFATFEGTLSLLTKSFRYDDEKNSLLFAFVGFMLFLTQGVYRPLVKKMGERYFVRLGVVLMWLGLGGIGVIAWQVEATQDPDGLSRWFLLTLACAVFGFGFLTPSIQALISVSAAADKQGEVLGINASFSALARILGPMLGLFLFPLDRTHALPYLVAGALLAVVLLLLPRVPAPASRSPTALPKTAPPT